MLVDIRAFIPSDAASMCIPVPTDRFTGCRVDRRMFGRQAGFHSQKSLEGRTGWRTFSRRIGLLPKVFPPLTYRRPCWLVCATSSFVGRSPLTKLLNAPCNCVRFDGASILQPSTASDLGYHCPVHSFQAGQQFVSMRAFYPPGAASVCGKIPTNEPPAFRVNWGVFDGQGCL